jgi:hypothetical protein
MCLSQIRETLKKVAEWKEKKLVSRLLIFDHKPAREAGSFVFVSIEMKRNESDIIIACSHQSEPVKNAKRNKTKVNENDTKERTKRKGKLNEAKRRGSTFKSRFCKEVNTWSNISRRSRPHYQLTYFAVDSWTNIY